MAFTQAEIVFYIVVSIFGVAGGIIRHMRDGGSDSWIRDVGRCLSSWVVAFGAIGLWVGNDPSSVTSPFYFLAASALVGYVAPDIHEQIVEWLIEEIKRRVGFVKKKID